MAEGCAQPTTRVVLKEEGLANPPLPGERALEVVHAFFAAARKGHRESRCPG